MRTSPCGREPQLVDTREKGLRRRHDVVPVCHRGQVMLCLVIACMVIEADVVRDFLGQRRHTADRLDVHQVRLRWAV